MSLRTTGKTRTCAGCRFWSEMIARVGQQTREVEALCLVPTGPKKGRYLTAGDRCMAWRSGHHGPVDDVPDYGEAVRAKYLEEEGVS